MSDEAIVIAEHLSHSYKGVLALDDLSLKVNKGAIFGLVGPDGAGKTTTMRILAGVIRPQRGVVRVKGLNPSDHRSGVREFIGYMPERYSLYHDLTVAENLRFFASLFGLDSTRFRERSSRLLAITRLADVVTRRVDALSGGMYKKLALACALLHQPEVLILDEATNGVDTISRRELWDLLQEFATAGMTIIISTSYMDEAERCTDLALIHAGRLLMQGRPRDLMRRFEDLVLLVSRVRDEGVLERFGQAILGVVPWGGGLRVVVRHEAAAAFEAALHAAGAECERLRAGFEDLFLAAMHGNVTGGHEKS